MAVKSSIFAVILTSCVCLVLLMPVTQVLQESEIVSEIVKDEYHNEVLLSRLKRNVVIVAKCPRGMKFYNNQCWTPEEYKRQQDKDYDDEVSTVGTANDITKDEATQKSLPHSDTGVTNFTTYTETTVNINHWSNTETNHNHNAVRYTTESSSDDLAKKLEEKDKTTVTANHTTSTEKTYNSKTETDATVTSTDKTDKNTLKRKFYELVAFAIVVFAIFCWIGRLIWLPRFFCQCYLSRNELERSTPLLPSLTEVISSEPNRT